MMSFCFSSFLLSFAASWRTWSMNASRYRCSYSAYLSCGRLRPNSVSSFEDWPSRWRRRERGQRDRCSLGGVDGLDDVCHGEGVDLVARLHHLLFEIEEDLGEARLFFGQGEDGLVDDLQAKGGADALAATVGDMEVDAGVGAGFVDGGVGGSFDLQLVGGLNKDQPMVGDGLRVASKEVGVDVERARHLGRSGQG